MLELNRSFILIGGGHFPRIFSQEFVISLIEDPEFGTNNGNKNVPFDDSDSVIFSWASLCVCIFLFNLKFIKVTLNSYHKGYKSRPDYCIRIIFII